MSDACMRRIIEQRDSAAWATDVLALAGCDRMEIVVTLYEHERAASIHPMGWPAAVRADVERYAREWQERNPARAIRAVTYAAPQFMDRQTCVLIVHHTPKG